MYIYICQYLSILSIMVKMKLFYKKLRDKVTRIINGFISLEDEWVSAVWVTWLFVMKDRVKEGKKRV